MELQEDQQTSLQISKHSRQTICLFLSTINTLTERTEITYLQILSDRAVQFK